jgi:hypothetical protein
MSARSGNLTQMPSAVTMLSVYQRLVLDARGAGLAGVGEQARLGATIRALLDIVNADLDPRRASDR